MRLQRLKILLTTMVMIGAAAMLLPLLAESREPREVVIVARQMTFYAAGSDVPNPTLYMEPGERLRVTFVNDDAGVSHDFAIKTWSTGTSILRGKGRTSIVIQAPERAGTAEYVCSLHGSMMSGRIHVGSETSRPTSER
jgi:plastocyanin